jgi:hypothetical protein
MRKLIVLINTERLERKNGRKAQLDQYLCSAMLSICWQAAGVQGFVDIMQPHDAHQTACSATACMELISRVSQISLCGL